MAIYIKMFLAVMAVSGVCCSPFPAWANGVREAMVKIYAIQSKPDYANPWNMQGPTPLRGSGCIITGSRILTNAHVVSDVTHIEVRRDGDARKYEARVASVAHEVDLALLEVDDPRFFAGGRALEIGELPQVQQDVLVYGFPYGGDTLSTTKGVISRIEHQVYEHSYINFLAAQLDAAINPGSSGGPVIVGDKVVGVVMQMMDLAENIGYMVPTPVIKHFMTDLEDGRYDGFPLDGVLCQYMENDGIRRKYGLAKEQTGVLVYRIVPGTPAVGRVRVGDVIMAVDGHDIANDGTVEIRPRERTSMNYYTEMHQVGETLDLTVLRDGKVRKVELLLDKPVGKNRLVPMEQYDIRPTYYIYGGFVFTPLTVNYLKTWGEAWQHNAPKNLVSAYLYDHLTEKDEQIVTLVRVLPDTVNKGYHDAGDFRVYEVNGKRVNNLKELIRTVEEGDGSRYISFTDKWGAKLVLDRREVAETNDEILQKYRVPADRSLDLRNQKK